MWAIPDEALEHEIEHLKELGVSDEMIVSRVQLKLSRLSRAAAKAEHETVLASISERQWQAIRDEAAKHTRTDGQS